jgi:2',3'-cyclic-nucleotide 2'-phosphodiesterase/3'-nucleotidase
MEMGIGLLERFMRESNAPLLGANVVFSGTTEPFFQPYVILERGGIRIAFLGITIPIQSECITVEICKGLAVVNMLDPTRYWMNRILTRESPDLVIGVFHAGIPHGVDSLQYGKSCFYENNTIHIAESIPGFDALILGHLHRTLIKRIVNVNGDSVWLVEPGMGGRDVGVLDFEVQKRPGEKAKIISSSVHIQNVTQFPLSDEMMEEVEEECELFAIIAGEPVAILLDTMCNVKAYFGPSFFVDIIHRVQLEHTGADISFASPLSTNVLIPSGPLIFSDLFRVYRFENMMTVLRMSGQEIKDYLEFSYNKWVNQMRSPRDRMLRTKPVPTGSTAFLGRNFIIPQYYFDSAAGIDYEVDLRRPFGERIRILRMSSGEPFHENRMYSVVTTSYRVAGAGGHFQAGAGITPQVLPYRIVSVENIMIRELIRKDFVNQGEVSSFSFNNWRFIPESFVRQAKMREYDELKAR